MIYWVILIGMFHAYKKCKYPSIIFFYILDFVLVKLFIFFLDIVSIVAKTTKFLERIPYFKSIVPHIKKKSIVSRINVKKMILKFHYA